MSTAERGGAYFREGIITCYEWEVHIYAIWQVIIVGC